MSRIEEGSYIGVPAASDSPKEFRLEESGGARSKIGINSTDERDAVARPLVVQEHHRSPHNIHRTPHIGPAITVATVSSARELGSTFFYALQSRRMNAQAVVSQLDLIRERSREEYEQCFDSLISAGIRFAARTTSKGSNPRPKK